MKTDVDAEANPGNARNAATQTAQNPLLPPSRPAVASRPPRWKEAPFPLICYVLFATDRLTRMSLVSAGAVDKTWIDARKERAIPIGFEIARPPAIYAASNR